VLEADVLKRGDITGRIDLQGTPRQLRHRLRLVLDRHLSLTAEGELALTGEGSVALETTGSLTDIDPAAFLTDPLWAGKVNADFKACRNRTPDWTFRPKPASVA
jgi:hypothetical protein